MASDLGKLEISINIHHFFTISNFGLPELYNLEADPDELHNLAGDSSYAKMLGDSDFQPFGLPGRLIGAKSKHNSDLVYFRIRIGIQSYQSNHFQHGQHP